MSFAEDHFIGTELTDLVRLKQMVRRRYKSALNKIVHTAVEQNKNVTSEQTPVRIEAGFFVAEEVMEAIEEEIMKLLEFVNDSYLVLLVSESDDAVFRDFGGINEDVGPEGDSGTIIKAIAFASARRDALNILKGES